LAASFGDKFGRSQTKKSSSEVAKQFERARKNNTERLARASLYGTSHAAKSNGAADKKG
jgi:hypothetical protein